MNKDELVRCLNDPDYLIKKYFLNKKYCMAYDKSQCNGNIIESHVISSKFLKNIARDNHIYDIF